VISAPFLVAVKGAIVDAMPSFPVGNPADPTPAVGPMVTQKQFERVQSCIRKAVEESATVLVGGEGLSTRPGGGEPREAHGVYQCDE